MDKGIVYSGETAFDYYSVVDEVYNGRPARVLYSKERIAAQSGIARDDKSELLFDYNERFMELVRGLNPKHVLVIGGGAFTFPAALLAENPDIYIDIVEIDEGLVPIAVDYFDFQPSPRTDVFIGDGQAFLRKTTTRSDLIIVDVFTGSALPPTLQTTTFAESLANHLKPNGLVAMNLISSFHGTRTAVLNRQLAAMHPSFPHIAVYPAGHGVSGWFPQNLVLTASLTPVETSAYIRYAPITL